MAERSSIYRAVSGEIAGFRPKRQLVLLVSRFMSRRLNKGDWRGDEIIRLLMRPLRVLLIPALLWHLADSRPARAGAEPSLSTHVATRLVGNGTAGPYGLEGHLILEGTEKVKKDGLLLRGDHDYLMDYDRGTITFSFALVPADTLLVNYQKLNLNLRRRYFHRELVYQGDRHETEAPDLPGSVGSGGSKESRWKFLPQGSSSDLELSGSKTFSLQVGSAQDLSLKQGLWLSAKGKTARDMEVSLQLSDQNMPATPQGSTKRLEELDKVQLLVKSPNFSGTLGDLYLAPSGSELFFYEKKLKGIAAEAGAGRSSAWFALASSKGEYFTNRLPGQENKQGPYQLQGKNGEISIMVLPGTERVWVDGEKMVRGSDNDYTIDYSRGTVQFTPRRLITSESRITVDFEYSTESYQRDFYSGSVLASLLGGRAELKVTGIHEADDKNRPSAFSLSAEDRGILSQAGNDRFAASKDGANLVGPGTGDYDLALDSSGNTYYQYVGNDSGSYAVSFSRVEDKEGSYRYVGGGVYQYVYPGNGDFSPVTLLPLPESHSLFDLGLSLCLTQDLKTEIEWAKSRRDKNTFSGKQDEHNWGDAVSFKSAYQNTDFQFFKSDFHRLELEGELRLLNKDFDPFGRVDVVEKERRWDLPGRSLSTDEKTYSLSGLVSPFEALLMNFDFGKLEAKEIFASRRRSVGVEVFPASWISARGKNEKIESREVGAEGTEKRGEWIRNLIVLNNNFRRLSTRVSWEQERRGSSVSGSTEKREDFDQLGGKISLGLSGVVKTSTQLSYREDHNSGEARASRSTSYTWRSQLSVRQYKDMLSSDLEFARRIRSDLHSSGEPGKQDLLVGRMDFHPPSQLLTLRLYHSQNQIHSAQRWDTYLEVEQGRGEYRYEDGEYVPDPEGDFVRLSEWAGETRPSLELNKSIRMIFSPHKVSPRGRKGSFWSQVGRIFSTDSFINLRGRFADDKPLGHYIFYPLTRLSGESVLFRNSTVRHDLFVLPTCRPLSLRFRWEKGEDDDNLLSAGSRSEERLKQEILLKSHLSSRNYVETGAAKESIRARRENKAGELISGKNLGITFTSRQTRALELKVSGEYRKRDEKATGSSAEFFSLTPELLLSLLSKGRLSARFGWTHLRSVPEGKSLSYVLGQGKRRGENYQWRCFFDYKLNRYLTTSATYSGESVPDRKAKHTARMELKAFF